MESYDNLMSTFLGYFFIFCSILILSMTITLEFNEFLGFLFGSICVSIALVHGVDNVR